TANARIGYELGLHRAGGRIGSDGIEVDYVVEQPARLDVLVQLDPLGSGCGSSAVARGAHFARDCRAHDPHARNRRTQPLDDGHDTGFDCRRAGSRAHVVGAFVPDDCGDTRKPYHIAVETLQCGRTTGNRIVRVVVRGPDD